MSFENVLTIMISKRLHITRFEHAISVAMIVFCGNKSILLCKSIKKFEAFDFGEFQKSIVALSIRFVMIPLLICSGESVCK